MTVEGGGSMSQLAFDGFGMTECKVPQKYSQKSMALVYLPRGEQPCIASITETSRHDSLVAAAMASSVSREEKAFLVMAAARHVVFNYERCADYYAHASPEMQRLMEDSALVVVDIGSAVANGFANLCEELMVKR